MGDGPSLIIQQFFFMLTSPKSLDEMKTAIIWNVGFGRQMNEKFLFFDPAKIGDSVPIFSDLCGVYNAGGIRFA